MKTLALRFSVNIKDFKHEAFWKIWRQDNRGIFLPEFSSNKNKMSGDCCVFKFLRGGVSGKHLIRFQSENAGFQFLRGGVNGKHLICFQSENAGFQFLRGSVNGKHLICFQSENAGFQFLRGGVNGKHLICFQSENAGFQFLRVWCGRSVREETVCQKPTNSCAKAVRC